MTGIVFPEAGIKNYRGILYSILLAMLGLPALAQSHVVLKTEFQDIPPKFIEIDGSFSGISYEIMQLVERKSNYRFTYDNLLVSIARVTRNLTNGLTDIQFGLQKTPEREKTIIYGPSLYTVKIIGVMLKNDPSKPTSLSQLIETNSVILTQTGTATAEWLRSIPGTTIDDGGRTPEANLEKLIAGRGNILIYHNLTINYVLTNPKYTDKFRIVELDFGTTAGLGLEDQYLVYARTVPQEIQDDINRIIEEARTSGELATITDKYLK